MKKGVLILLGILILLAIMLFGQFPQSETTAAGSSHFKNILTRNTFNENWSGDPKYWRFEDSVLVGEITPETIMLENTFLIWRGGTVGDFELKVEYRITPRGNSGINYRSEVVNGSKFVLRGYQADIDGSNQYTGQIYEEQGRSFLARRSRITRIEEDNSVKVIGSTGDESELASVVKQEDWNRYHLVAHGNTLIHMINGRVMSIAVDDGNGQKKEGVLGLQLHRGPPMKVEFRNLRLKQFQK